MSAYKKLGIVIVAVGALAAGATLSHFLLKSGRTVSEQVTLYAAPRPVPEFCLTDDEGKAFCDDELADHWTLLFFGFSHCPDICPTTLSTLANALRHMDGDGIPEPPEVVLISVDPMRDTPEQLSDYVNYFDPRFKGVTGNLTEIQKLTGALGVAFRYVAGEEEGGYTVEHTAAIFLVGPDAAVRALFQPPHDPETLARDLALTIASI